MRRRRAWSRAPRPRSDARPWCGRSRPWSRPCARATAASWIISAAPWPTMCTPSTRRLSAVDHELHQRPLLAPGEGVEQRAEAGCGRSRPGPPRARLGLGEAERRRLGLGEDRRRDQRVVRRAAAGRRRPSRRRPGPRGSPPASARRRSVTSPTAKIEGTAVCDQSSTATAPLAASLTPSASSPRPAVFGPAPGGEEHLVDDVRLAVVDADLEAAARPSRSAVTSRWISSTIAARAHGVGHVVAQVVVEAAQDLVAAVELDHVGAEAVHDAGELAGDVAAADDRACRFGCVSSSKISFEVMPSSAPGMSGTSGRRRWRSAGGSRSTPRRWRAAPGAGRATVARAAQSCTPARRRRSW